MGDFDAVLFHRNNETDGLRAVRLPCIDCGKPAEGNVSCDEGDLCDRCHAIACGDMLSDLELERRDASAGSPRVGSYWRNYE